MKSNVLALLFAAVFAAMPSASPAQEVEPTPTTEPTLINDLTAEFEDAQERRRDRERAEDAAIFSAILREDLRQLYAVDPHAKLSDPADDAIGQPLGAYLPEYGLVVQVQAPPPYKPPSSAADGEAQEPPLSRWEAARRYVRGEAPAPATWGQGCKACHVVDAETAFLVDAETAFRNRGSLFFGLGEGAEHWHRSTPGVPGPTVEQVQAALVNILAENGRHLRNLQRDDRVTIFLHYRRPPTSATEPSREPAAPSGDNARAEEDPPPREGAENQPMQSREAAVDP
ncbi:MAG: hypothetical protein KY475_22900, partial [Planctomycetes bacterium]|nr:hypothetical protein [Planctomycetota bacterium]